MAHEQGTLTLYDRCMAVTSITDKVTFISRVFGSGNLSRNGLNFDVRCPACNSPDKQKKKLSILVTDDVAHCWSCGLRGSLWKLIREFGTREELLEYRDRFAPADGARTRCLWVDAPGDKRVELPGDFKLLAASTSRDPDVLATKRYMVNRGASERDLWYFRVGTSADPRWCRRAIVPSFDANGTLNHFTARSVDARRRPKYDGPEHDKLSIVFNELNVDWARELVLCEGVFDLMKCPENAVPLLGSDLREESALFNAIVANNTPIVLMLDSDMRVKKAPKIAKLLAGYNVSVRMALLPDGTDPGDLSRAHVKRVVDEAKPFCWRDAFMDRLDAASGTRL